LFNKINKRIDARFTTFGNEERKIKTYTKEYEKTFKNKYSPAPTIYYIDGGDKYL